MCRRIEILPCTLVSDWLVPCAFPLGPVPYFLNPLSSLSPNPIANHPTKRTRNNCLSFSAGDWYSIIQNTFLVAAVLLFLEKSIHTFSFTCCCCYSAVAYSGPKPLVYLFCSIHMVKRISYNRSGCDEWGKPTIYTEPRIIRGKLSSQRPNDPSRPTRCSVRRLKCSAPLMIQLLKSFQIEFARLLV